MELIDVQNCCMHGIVVCRALWWNPIVTPPMDGIVGPYPAEFMLFVCNNIKDEQMT